MHRPTPVSRSWICLYESTRIRLILSSLLLALAYGGTASAAIATHSFGVVDGPGPAPDGIIVYVGPTPDDFQESYDLGYVEIGERDARWIEVSLDDGADHYVAVAAYAEQDGERATSERSEPVLFAAAPPPPPADSDGDGIPDESDLCPQDNPNDTDGDGICDSVDVCPGANDALDSDGDGAPDCLDACPLDNPNDSDGDGVCDSNDLCVGDDNIDTDGDGIPDGCDACPADNPDDSDGDGICDSQDQHPGQDDNLDSDGDGVVDAADAFPFDPAETVDTDGDGVGDNRDAYPNDPDRTEIEVGIVSDHYRVNAGGGSYTDPEGNEWAPDSGYVNTGQVSSGLGDTLGTDLDTVYSSQRWDSGTAPEMEYSFVVEPGRYLVRLHLTEKFSAITAAGMRVFSVAMESQTVLGDIDVFAKVGFGTALIEEVEVDVDDGTLNIEFLHGVQNPTVYGIEVLPMPAEPPPLLPPGRPSIILQ